VDLEIGKLFEQDEEHVLEELGYDLDLPEDRPAWARHEGPAERIALLNLASLVFFTDYVARLEGLKDTNHALGRTRFKNLPFRETSIWLPVPLEHPLDEASPDRPIFIGSALDLLEDLAEIQRRSDLGLGAVPKAYDDMRANFEEFAGLPSFRLDDDRDTIRWVWRGLRDGAELAVRVGAPMCCLAA
jgi:hypothetical protein